MSRNFSVNRLTFAFPNQTPQNSAFDENWSPFTAVDINLTPAVGRSHGKLELVQKILDWMGQYCNDPHKLCAWETAFTQHVQQTPNDFKACALLEIITNIRQGNQISDVEILLLAFHILQFELNQYESRYYNSLQSLTPDPGGSAYSAVMSRT